MKLSDLLLKSGIKTQPLKGDDPEIKSITYDSRKVKAGDLFFAIQGSNSNGEEFAQEAAKKGCSAICSEHALQTNIPQITVENIKNSMAYIAETFYGEPSGEVEVIGVTGTNGKTTVTYMLESIAKHKGAKCAVFGTVNYRFENKIFSIPNTTAESADISNLLSQFKNKSGQYAFIEVSSQGLDRKCVEAIRFASAIYTNLSHEHLDWHGNMEQYALAKRRLFELMAEKNEQNGLAVINADDSFGSTMTTGLPLKIITYGITNKADYTAKLISSDISGSVFTVSGQGKETRINLKLPGLYNVTNALAAFVWASEAGFGNNTIKDGLEKLEDVPGRLSKISSAKGFTVYVDYAHTPDALKNVIAALKPLTAGRLITVFGAGGNRDRGKRPEMGEAAAGLSDFVWLTSDNPRNENPADIALDIEVGLRKKPIPYKVELDRKKAILGAIEMAEKDDIILLAGKGHEDCQVIGTKKLRFSDMSVVKEILTKIDSDK